MKDAEHLKRALEAFGARPIEIDLDREAKELAATHTLTQLTNSILVKRGLPTNDEVTRVEIVLRNLVERLNRWRSRCEEQARRGELAEDKRRWYQTAARLAADNCVTVAGTWRILREDAEAEKNLPD